MNYTDITALGAIVIVVTLMIKEIFAWLKTRNGEAILDKTNRELLDELKLMNSNHLHEITEAIRGGDRDIVQAINNGNARMIELLGEIKGRLK
ncbi:MAG: hypothetical protein M0P93_07440 [Candidatus Cloacimonetes bacterium]|nr:hypothetical protein [Candidatus Cloacimonadota bacterium]